MVTVLQTILFCICHAHLLPLACIFFSSSAPSAPPQNVECTSLSSTSIRVSWVAPPVSSRNGALTRYSMAYQAVAGEDTSRHVVDNIPPNVSSWEIKDLEKWTEYRVWVRAHTDVGAGPESPPVIVRTDEDGKCPGPTLTYLHNGLTLSPVLYLAPFCSPETQRVCVVGGTERLLHL